MSIPDTKSPRVKIIIPTKSSRNHKFETFLEWFVKVWYAADVTRHMTAVRRKKAKIR
jgi:hypothetical protein